MCELITCEKIHKEKYIFLFPFFPQRKHCRPRIYLGKCCDVISSWWKAKIQETAEKSWSRLHREMARLLRKIAYCFLNCLIFSSKFLNRPRRTIHRLSLKTGYLKKCWFCFLVKVARVGEDDLGFRSCWSESPSLQTSLVKCNAKELWTGTGKTIQVWSFSSCNFLGSIHFFSLLGFFSTFSGSFILFILFGSISLLQSNPI